MGRVRITREDDAAIEALRVEAIRAADWGLLNACNAALDGHPVALVTCWRVLAERG